MFFDKKIFLENGDYFFISFDFQNVLYSSLKDGAAQFVFDGELILSDSDNAEITRRYFGFYFDYLPNKPLNECEFYSSNFWLKPRQLQKFVKPVKEFLTNDLCEILPLFLEFILDKKTLLKKLCLF